MDRRRALMASQAGEEDEMKEWKLISAYETQHDGESFYCDLNENFSEFFIKANIAVVEGSGSSYMVRVNNVSKVAKSSYAVSKFRRESIILKKVADIMIGVWIKGEETMWGNEATFYINAWEDVKNIKVEPNGQFIAGSKFELWGR